MARHQGPRSRGQALAASRLPRMSYVERDGIWHIVARTEEAEAVTVCDLRIVQQTYPWQRVPIPVCSVQAGM